MMRTRHRCKEAHRSFLLPSFHLSFDVLCLDLSPVPNVNERDHPEETAQNLGSDRVPEADHGGA